MYINVNDVAEVKLAEEKKNVNYSESTLLSLLLFLLYHHNHHHHHHHQLPDDFN